MQLATDTALVHTDNAARRNVPSQVALRSLQVGRSRHELPGMAVRERSVLSPPVRNKRQPARSDHLVSILVCHR